jgi:uncharacterized membrane protein
MAKKSLIIVIVCLAVFLFAALSYIVYDKYITANAIKEYNLARDNYQKGLNDGYTQAVVQLMNQAATCQQVPINYQNQTLNIIAVDCLRQTN